MNKLYFSPLLFACISLAAQPDTDSSSISTTGSLSDALSDQAELVEIKGIKSCNKFRIRKFPGPRTIDNMPIYHPPENFKFNMPVYPPDPKLHFNMPIIRIPELK